MKTYLKGNKETICSSSILDACTMKDNDGCSNSSYSQLNYQMIYQRCAKNELNEDLQQQKPNGDKEHYDQNTDLSQEV